MKTNPNWLPAKLNFQGCCDKIDFAYSVFKKDFEQSNTNFMSYPVTWDKNNISINNKKYAYGFWHLISKKQAQVRIFDIKRAEKLPWCKASIVNYTNQEILYWKYLEGNGKIRFYLWLRNYDYLIILEEKITSNYKYYYLVTAFHIDGQSKKRQLNKKYTKRII